MMKSTHLLILATLVCLAVQLPFKEQIALVNSLEVGRLEDPMTWTCVGCDQDNKPLRSFLIEEKSVEIRAILSIYEEYTVLAFRYTANLKNVWQDLLWAFQRQDDDAPAGCKVQKTYDDMWEYIRDDVISDLRKYVHTTRLIITGISLGGGLASLSFIDIKASGEFQNLQVITFGSPRVGNRKWAKFYNSEATSTRIFIRRDPINFLPRCLTPFCNYSPVGDAVKCFPKRQECVYLNKVQEESDDLSLSSLLEEVEEHKEELIDGQYEGIIDHIFGYKKIINYSLVK